MAGTSVPHHPAPHRRRAGWPLVFGLAAAPLAWLTQTSVNYAVSSHACYPADEPFLAMLTQWPWPAVLVIDILAIIIGVAGTLAAWSTWQKTREEAAGEVPRTLEAGEGRTRFLALWGTMASGGFTIALIFSLIAIIGVPPCGYP